MALRIEGRVTQITPIEEGQGARGPWKKRMLIIDTLEQFPRKVAFVLWNEKAEALDNLGIGQRVVVDFAIESREFNGRWYTDARAFGIKVVKEEDVVGRGSSMGTSSSQTRQDYSQPTNENSGQDTLSHELDNTNEYDDLLSDDFNNDMTTDDELFTDDNSDDDLPF